ncbi:hypothetical protein [Actinoplanes sp. NPDC051411]|uniref:hypothetical protein n=1 Tax=Actinoplanes sp. NPDC051411 TaxID=3155522 RepID=UPI003430EC7A
MTSIASPFAPTDLYPARANGATDSREPGAPPTGATLLTPFAESISLDRGELDREAADALFAELDDEEFEESVRALADEAAGRHLRSIGTWSAESGAPALATDETEQWMGSVAAEADRMLGRLAEHFADRPVDSLRDGECEAVAGLPLDETGPEGPLAAQEQFFKSLLKKATSLASGVKKLATKGFQALGRLLPLGKLFDILRRLVRPLLQRVLSQAIGKLPAQFRPLATKLAARFGGSLGEAENDLAGEFDRRLAEVVLTGNEAAIEQSLAEADQEAREESGGPQALHDLDAARARLAGRLAEAAPEQPLTAQLEQFIPVVMAAKPLIKMAIGIIGREKIVNFVGDRIAVLLKGMAGPEPAKFLSRHIASAGLGLLGLEAEAAGTATLGAEALVATTEDTISEVLELPPALLGDELLLEAEIQEAFAAAAARHLPAAALRPEVVEGESEGEHGVWVMMPRAGRPCYRFKQYSRVVPVRISRPIARSVVMAGGDTLERRLLDAGVAGWPVTAEMEIYELLDGAGPGHLAAYEVGDLADLPVAAREFEELTAPAATALAHNPRLAYTGRRGHGGRRYYRLRVGGRPLRRHRLFGLALDLTSPQPVLRVHLRIGEREAHLLAGHLDQQQMVQVVSTVRAIVGPAAQQRLGERLERLLTKHGMPQAAGGGRKLSGQLADAIVGAVSAQLPAAAATLSRAAKDPAAGITLTFAFAYPDRAAIGTAAPAGPTLTIRPGLHRG